MQTLQQLIDTLAKAYLERHQTIEAAVGGGDRPAPCETGMQMTVRLDPQIGRILRGWGEYAIVLALGSDDQAAVLFKAPAADVAAWHGLPVLWQWEMGLYASGAVLRLYLAVIDVDWEEVVFDAETFLNPASHEDREVIEALIRQETIAVHFFDQVLEHRRSTRCESHREQGAQIAALLRRADEHLSGLAGDELNFVAAKQAMMRDRVQPFDGLRTPPSVAWQPIARGTS